MIDLDLYYPDWKFAQNHGLSSLPGRKPIIQKNKLSNTAQLICPCCNNFINKHQQSILNNAKQLDFLGVGFPVYYLFIKHCIALILLMIISYNALSLYKAILINQIPCSHQDPTYHRMLNTNVFHCTSWMIFLARTDAQVTGDQTVIRIFSYILHVLMLIYMRDSITKTIQYFDQRTCSMSDFTLQIKGLPLEDGIKGKINRLFQSAFKQKYQIMEMTLLPHTEQFEQKLNEKRQILKQMFKQASKQQRDEFIFLDLRDKLKSQQTQINKYLQTFRLNLQQDIIQCSKAIITLNSQQCIKKIHSQFSLLQSQQVQSYFIGSTSQLQLLICPQPKQIIWQDVNYPQNKRMFRILLGWVLTVGFVALATLGFYFILISKSHYLEENVQTHIQTAVFLVYFLIVIVILFNKFVMGPVLHYFTHLQKHESSDKVEASFALKYALGMFFTTALMTLAVEVVNFHNFYTHLYGVIQEQTVFFFFNAFFVPLIWIINPFQIFMLIKRKYYYGSDKLTQRQANKLMQKFQFDMGKRYAQILQTMWFTFLYLTLIPIGAIFTFIGLSCYYWVDKYNLLHRSSITSHVSGNMGLYAMKQLDFTLLCRAVGQAIFDSQIRDGVRIETIVFICFGVVYLLVPLDQIIDFFNHQEFYDQTQTFTYVRHKIKDTYQTLHPIYSRIHQKQFTHRLKSIIMDSLDMTADGMFGRSNSKLMG